MPLTVCRLTERAHLRRGAVADGHRLLLQLDVWRALFAALILAAGLILLRVGLLLGSFSTGPLRGCHSGSGSDGDCGKAGASASRRNAEVHHAKMRSSVAGRGSQPLGEPCNSLHRADLGSEPPLSEKADESPWNSRICYLWSHFAFRGCSAGRSGRGRAPRRCLHSRTLSPAIFPRTAALPRFCCGGYQYVRTVTRPRAYGGLCGGSPAQMVAPRSSRKGRSR